MAYNPFYEQDLHHAGPPRIVFSRTELLHLSVAAVALTFGFSLIYADRSAAFGGYMPVLTWDLLLIAFVGVGTGFVLHELAHKVLAQRYGHWAEFRAQFMGLGLTILIAAATRLLLAAPGAVLIQGRVTPRENGLISLAGPATNFLVAGLAIGGYWIGLNSSPTWGVDVDDFMPSLLIGVARINGVLALFNLVPLGPLDGRKVLRWNPVAYGFALALAIVLMVVVHLYDPA
ncbi:MAG: M50 family metallopeptidase [Thermoplasmatota archaeon]